MPRPEPPILLFGTPRSGSTLVQSALAGYLEPRGVRQLLDPLDLNKGALLETAGGLVCRPYPVMALFPKPLSPRLHRLVLAPRYALLRKYHGRYLYKVFPHQRWDCRRQFDWLLRNSTVVWIERRNLFAQFVSFLVARVSGQWVHWGGKRRSRPRRVELNADLVRDFELEIFEYLAQKQRRRPSRVLVYEDLPRPIAGETIVAEALGLASPPRGLAFRLPMKQNADNPLRLFRDPGQVIDAYRSSRLQKLWRI
jgi:hypothetical protein